MCSVIFIEVMLFCYLVLMFNGYCIYYDVDYVCDVEGYDGLVFYGFFIVIFLVDFVCVEMGCYLKFFLFCGVFLLVGMQFFDI